MIAQIALVLACLAAIWAAETRITDNGFKRFIVIAATVLVVVVVLGWLGVWSALAVRR